jgi:uncharacterized membrane protein
MHKGRLEAFSDGVIAIIITIMVLELRAPHEATLAALDELLPTMLGYVLSFVFIGIYWNNHHHTFQAVREVDGTVLWANLFLLFWLSIVPFATAWMGETHFASLPVAVYGAVLLMSGVAYTILLRRLMRAQGNATAFANAIGSDAKGKISLLCYIVSIPLAFVNPLISCALFVMVSLIWFIPDRRMERAAKEK